MAFCTLLFCDGFSAFDLFLVLSLCGRYPTRFQQVRGRSKMADSGGKTLRAFVTILHLPDDDKSTGDEIISNAGSVIEDFQRFFVLHFQILITRLMRCSAIISASVRPTHSQPPRSSARLKRCAPYCLHIQRSAFSRSESL